MRLFSIHWGGHPRPTQEGGLGESHTCHDENRHCRFDDR
jgi:hypothetical protein